MLKPHAADTINEVILMLKHQQYPKYLVLGIILLSALAAPSVGLAGNQPAFKTGNYIGTTSQGEPIALTVKPKIIKHLVFTLDVTCADGQTQGITISGPGSPIHHGAFSFGAMLSGGGEVHVDGKLKGATASGHLSGSVPNTPGADCVATGIKWHAHA